MTYLHIASPILVSETGGGLGSTAPNAKSQPRGHPVQKSHKILDVNESGRRLGSTVPNAEIQPRGRPVPKSQKTINLAAAQDLRSMAPKTEICPGVAKS